MKENELKKLSTELRLLKNHEDNLISKRKVLQNNINNNVNECKTIKINIKEKQQEIKRLSKGKNTIVSEHAILRYLERVCDLDIENIKGLIINDDFKKLNLLIKGDGIIKKDGVEYILKDNVIITVK